MSEKPLREVNVALVATMITLAVAVGLDTTIPRLGLAARSAQVELKHKRDFRATPAGGEIEYFINPDSKNPAEEVALIKKDLEILSNRFKRGQFEMITLTGSKLSPEVKNLKPLAKSYTYSVTTGAQSATLKITGPAQPMSDYLKYLSTSWNF